MISLPSLSLSASARQRISRWLLALMVCWQAMIGFMPVAQAKVSAGESGWETVCTMQGSSQIWLADLDADTDQQATSGGYCPICVAGHAGIAPPPLFDFKVHRSVGAEVGQLAFSAVFLTRAWSEPSTGPPVQHLI